MEMDMKALIASVATVLAVSAAVPATAQSWGRYDDFGRDRSEAERMDRRIDNGLRNGQLTQREAALLRRDVDQVRRLEWRYARDGRISGSEARDLEHAYAQVTARLRFERRDPERGYGAGYGNGYGGYGGGYSRGYRY